MGSSASGTGRDDLEPEPFGGGVLPDAGGVEGYRSTLKPTAFQGKSPSSNLSAQVIHQEQPLSEKAALNPDWVEWLMGFPKGWTAVSSGERNPQMSPA